MRRETPHAQPTAPPHATHVGFFPFQNTFPLQWRTPFDFLAALRAIIKFGTLSGLYRRRGAWATWNEAMILACALPSTTFPS